MKPEGRGHRKPNFLPVIIPLAFRKRKVWVFSEMVILIRSLLLWSWRPKEQNLIMLINHYTLPHVIHSL